MVKQSFTFFPPPFGLGYISTWKINMGELSIHWVVLPTLFCISDSFVSLFFLPNLSNPHSPTLEHTNPSRLDPDRCRPNMGS